MVTDAFFLASAKDLKRIPKVWIPTYWYGNEAAIQGHISEQGIREPERALRFGVIGAREGIFNFTELLIPNAVVKNPTGRSTPTAFPVHFYAEAYRTIEEVKTALTSLGIKEETVNYETGSWGVQGVRRNSWEDWGHT